MWWVFMGAPHIDRSLHFLREHCALGTKTFKNVCSETAVWWPPKPNVLQAGFPFLNWGLWRIISIGNQRQFPIFAAQKRIFKMHCILYVIIIRVMAAQFQSWVGHQEHRPECPHWIKLKLCLVKDYDNVSSKLGGWEL